MSHFSVVVLLPRNTPRNREVIEEKAGELLAPYDENLEVPEYDCECWCLGHVAQKEVGEITDKKYGTIGEIRNKFWKDHPGPQAPMETADISKEEMKKLWEKYSKEEAVHNKIWQKLTGPRFKEFEKLLKKHPKRKASDPDCEECHGKGTYRSTRSLKAKWDWWTVGGRWTGGFDPGYDPDEDPRNLEECNLCKGTGTRTMPVPGEPDWKPKKGECNGCGGKGISTKFQLAPFTRDVMPANKIPKDYVPFAIVTPDGKWHEKGEMGWWAMVSNEDKSWEKKGKELLWKHELCLAVLVDAHI